MTEVWKPVLGYEDLYLVSCKGRVKSTSRLVRHRNGWMRISEKLLKPWAIKTGHLYVTLSKQGRQLGRQVHRLVLEAFVGPRPEGMQACHFPDRSPGNNRLENLMWGTSHENHEHMKTHGTSCKRHSYKNVPRGDNHPHAKLTEEQVREIKKELKAPVRGKQRQLARKYGVTEATICDIKKGRIRSTHGDSC